MGYKVDDDSIIFAPGQAWLGASKRKRVARAKAGKRHEEATA